MFVCESEPARGMAVLVMGPPPRPDDWSRYIQTVSELNAIAPRDVRPVLIQYLAGAVIPDAVSRRALGDVRRRIRADALNVVITTSQVVRAAQRAVDWWHEPAYETSTHADEAAALAHVEARLGRASPELRELCRRALRRVAG